MPNDHKSDAESVHVMLSLAVDNDMSVVTSKNGDTGKESTTSVTTTRRRGDKLTSLHKANFHNHKPHIHPNKPTLDNPTTIPLCPVEMGTTEDRKEHFAKKRLTFLLATFIIGVLCSTHPRKYFKDAEYGHRSEETSQDNSKKRSKKKKHKHKQSARAEEDSTEREEWNPPKKVRYEDEVEPRTSRMPGHSRESNPGLHHPRPGRYYPPVDHDQRQ